MITIYSPRITPRLQYTARQVFEKMLGVQYVITQNKDEFIATAAARINYSDSFFDGALQIVPAGLLWEENIRKFEPKVDWDSLFDDRKEDFDIPVLFSTEGEFPFDIFSAVFYLLSRYEEYTQNDRDMHGRFMPQQSIAYKNGFLEQPIVNIWVYKLYEIMNRRWAAIAQPVYTFLPTLDIDQSHYYRYKPLLRQIAGGVKQLLSGNFDGLRRRLQSLTSEAKDPNNTFDWLEEVHAGYDLQPTCFFHVGDKGPYDAPVPYTNAAFRDIVKKIAKNSDVGVHPSYNSFNKVETIKKEKQRLEEIIQRPVNQSRQHFLRFSLPETYRQLITCGITNEYSMGYANAVGYRAGIAGPFAWYDLEQEKETNLIVHPFAVMDVTLKNYMKLSTQEAKDKIVELVYWVKTYGGTFGSLWHNESLSEYGEWKGWRDVYERLLDITASRW